MAGQEQTSNYSEQGGAREVIGGSLDIISGGDLDIESGADFKIAGTKVSATAAELDNLDGPVAGTASASKAVVLGTNKNLDVLVIADGGFSLGAGAGTAVTATAAELNSLASYTGTTAALNAVDNAPVSFTFGIASAGANVSEITITAKDADSNTVAAPLLCTVWLSDAATGVGLTGTAASGTVQAKSASGADFGVLTAKKAIIAQTLATGIYILEITDSSKTTYYVCAQAPNGAVSISAQLASGDYG